MDLRILTDSSVRLRLPHNPYALFHPVRASSWLFAFTSQLNPSRISNRPELEINFACLRKRFRVFCLQRNVVWKNKNIKEVIFKLEFGDF